MSIIEALESVSPGALVFGLGGFGIGLFGGGAVGQAIAGQLGGIVFAIGGGAVLGWYGKNRVPTILTVN